MPDTKIDPPEGSPAPVQPEAGSAPSTEAAAAAPPDPAARISKITAIITAITAAVASVGALITTTVDVIQKNPWLPVGLLWISVLAFIGLGTLLIARKRNTFALGIALVLAAPAIGVVASRHITSLSSNVELDLKTYLQKAREYGRQGKRKIALAELDKARKLAPENRELKQADADLRKISDSEHRRVAQLKIEARQSSEDGDAKAASKLLEDAEQIDPWDPEIATLKDQITRK